MDKGDNATNNNNGWIENDSASPSSPSFVTIVGTSISTDSDQVETITDHQSLSLDPSPSRDSVSSSDSVVLSSPPSSQSPPRSSPDNNNNNNSISSNKQRIHHHATTTTPQMMVLGKDGSDYNDFIITSASKRVKGRNHMEKQQALLSEQDKVETFVDEPNQRQQEKSSTWWKSLWYGKTHDNDNNSDNNDYTSMEEQHAHGTVGAAHRPHQNHKDDDGDGDEETAEYYGTISATEEPNKDDSFKSQQRSTTLSKMHQSLLRNLPLPTTKEDQILQDCSFLYRPVQDDHHTTTSPTRNTNNRNHHRRSLRAVLDPPPDGVSTLYRDAQDVLSPPAVAQYQVRYHQLNQEYAHEERDRFEHFNEYGIAVPRRHDLTLQESSLRPTGHHHLTSGTLQSSLFFQHEANGRFLLRLPRDHVRLLVASPHDTAFPLEPGILSVIQCRRANDPPSKHLEYCLTVPPNLYQRVVSEMNQYAGKHLGGGGLDSSFYASDHADIRLAVGILVVIMVILGINTIVLGMT